jgi:hypothetical protein
VRRLPIDRRVGIAMSRWSWMWKDVVGGRRSSAVVSSGQWSGIREKAQWPRPAGGKESSAQPEADREG